MASCYSLLLVGKLIISVVRSN